MPPASPTAITDFPFSHLPRAAYAQSLAYAVGQLLPRALPHERLGRALAALCDAARVPRSALTVERSGVEFAELMSAEIRALVDAAHGDLLVAGLAGCLLRVDRAAMSDAAAARITAALLRTTPGCELRAAVRAALRDDGDTSYAEGLAAARSEGAAYDVALMALTGQKITVAVWPTLRIEALAHEAMERLDLQPGTARLICGGKQLDEERTVGAYGIGPGALLHVVTRLRGGMLAALSGQCDLGAVGAECAVVLVSKKLWHPRAELGWEPFVTAASCSPHASRYALYVPLPQAPAALALDAAPRAAPTVRSLLAALADLVLHRDASSFPARFALKPLLDEAPAAGDALLDTELDALRVGRYRVPAFKLSPLK